MINFPGKTRNINVAEEIGDKYFAVGVTLLKDTSGAIVRGIESQHGKNAERANMDILGRWIQGHGIADRTWQGLLGVLRVHCLKLAQDIEESLMITVEHKVHESQLYIH